MDKVILAMISFAFVGAVTPGPVNLLAISTSLNYGKKAAFWHVTGASLTYALVVFCSGSMMQSILTVLPRLELTMKLCGSLFLCYLVYKIGFAPYSSVRSSSSVQSGFRTGSLTQLLSPKAWMVAMSGVSLYVIDQGNETILLSLFTCISLIICFICVGLWAMIGRLFSAYLENPVRQRQFNRIMAGVLFASVVMIW
ncbi:LysE family translocator [Vibrio salinus]|uniref:LysE family translocator n=1 Tax=Vibrio salinus TaxID=2899784 RepID=UPI001E54A5BE|nr:LysE family translocator [Vibrio salinus]MCE0494172.1 LysE family translocator [Vibrio salinus]